MGQELLEISPVGFLAEDHALSIAILSCHGRINFGLLADPDAIGDIEILQAGLVESFGELLEATAAPKAAAAGEGR